MLSSKSKLNYYQLQISLRRTLVAARPQMSVVEFFEKRTAADGGRFDLSRFDTLNQQILNPLRFFPGTLSADVKLADVKPHASIPDRLYIDYVSNFSPNAFAIRKSPLYLIGWWIGLPIAIFNFYIELLRNTALFADVDAPPPAAETIFPQDFWNYQRLLNLRGSDRIDLVFAVGPFPGNKQRQLLVGSLIMLAYKFVQWHEVFHVTGGHLDFYHRRTGRQLMLEYDAKSTRGISAEIRQALELNADTCATSATVDDFLDAVKQYGEAGESPPPSVTGARGAARILTFVFGTIFFLITRFTRPQSANTEASHPNTRIRTRNAMNWTKDTLERRGLSSSEVELGRMDAVRDLKRVSEMIGTMYPAAANESQTGEIGREAEIYRSLIDLFHSLRPELEPEA